jgi:sugar/nucleoside kinase (ribokinase family)
MADKKIDLLCIGNALVDVFAQADERFFARHELSQPVQHVEIAKLKAILSELHYYTTISGGGAQKTHARHRACFLGKGNTASPSEDFSPVKMVSGGGAANAAKIAALLGAKVSFTGAIGNDEFGRFFEKSLAAAGVKLSLAIKPSPTGICLMLRNGAGETRIAASPSAAIELSESDISEEELRKARVVLIDGFMLDKSALALHVLQLAGRNGTPAAIDLSSPGIAREYAAEIAGFAKNYPLILFMNEAEAEAFRDGLKSAMQETLLEKNTILPIIVVKLGQGGALCYSEGKIIRAETQVVKPADTTGAGDAFCAGFLAAWIKNKTLSECAAFGNMTAGTVLGAEGSQADEKALKTLRKLLK